MSAAEVRSRLEEIGLNEHAELVRRVRVHCRSRDVAEDSVQEAYVELLLHADEICSVDSIKAWLIKVAVREARKAMEEYYRISKACLENEIAFGADDDLGRIFIADIFVQTLRKYPSYYAEVMQLHYMENCSFQEISRRLDISYAAVASFCRIGFAKRARISIVFIKIEALICSPFCTIPTLNCCISSNNVYCGKGVVTKLAIGTLRVIAEVRECFLHQRNL